MHAWLTPLLLNLGMGGGTIGGITGPYRVAKAQVHVAGATGGQLHVAGATKAQVHVAGATAGMLGGQP